MARVVCFGEALIRLSAPGAERLFQRRQVEMVFGGAEANVAVCLARWEHATALATALPSNVLGHAARDELRKHGVDCSHIHFGDGRMGLYFLDPGSVLRAGEVTYDRKHTAIVLADPSAFRWTEILRDADWLHISGVTPALGPNPAAAALQAFKAARAAGVSVCFDGNYRSKLWLGNEHEAPDRLRGLLELADLALVDARDIGLILKQNFNALDDASAAAFKAFPNLKRIACTQRVQSAADDHSVSAVMYTRQGVHRAPALDLRNVVDRIGAGDAFAAGILHALMAKRTDADALAFGLASAGLKHGVPGDFNLVTLAEVDAVLAGTGLGVKR